MRTFFAAVLASLSFAGSAGASPPLVPVKIDSETEPLVVELYSPTAKPSRDAPVAHCTSPCDVEVPAGRYKLYTPGGDDTVSGSRLIDVSGPATFTVRPKSEAQRTGGLLLGIAGPAMMLTGGLLMMSGMCAMSHSDATDCNERTETMESVGTALIFGGGLLTPVGWVLFGSSYKLDVAQGPRLTGLAPAVFPRGTGAADHIPGFVVTGAF